jgi:hypothetical protein
MLQSARVAVQARMQVESTHDASAMLALQSLPHVPQFFTSCAVSPHPPPDPPVPEAGGCGPPACPAAPAAPAPAAPRPPPPATPAGGSLGWIMPASLSSWVAPPAPPL